MEDWTELRVARKWPVAVDIVALELVSKTGAELPPFEPGAYIDVQIPGGLLRPYSLCNAPHQPNHYRIAVQRERDSRGASKWLHDRLQPGDALQVRRPLNDFPLDRSAVYSVLLAGGIGVTPLLSMAEDLWHRGAAFELHVCAKNAAQTPFFTELGQAAYRHRIHFHWSEDPAGRIGFQTCLSRLPSLTHAYVCGPSQFISSALGTALKLGWAHERLHFENFT